MLRPVIAVVGPTAAGKSELSLTLARTLGGEVVNADSMQLYQGMDIGTAKLTMAERRASRIICWTSGRSRRPPACRNTRSWPGRPSTTSATAAGRPILVGGSGLYVRAAIDKLEFPGTDPAAAGQAGSTNSSRSARLPLHARLAALDPAAAAAILPGNGRRIVRALEVIELSGRPFSATLPDYESVYPVVQIGVAMPRPELDRRIAERVDRMWQLGLVDEVRQLERRGPARGPDRQPGARLRPGAQVPGRGLDGGRGSRADGHGHPAVRAAAGVVVPARSAGAAGCRPGAGSCADRALRRCPVAAASRSPRPGGLASGACGSPRGTARGTTS